MCIFLQSRFVKTESHSQISFLPTSNVAGCELGGGSARDGIKSSLGCAVDAKLGNGQCSCGAGNVDNDPLTALLQQRRDGLVSADGALDVDVKDAVKVIKVCLWQVRKQGSGK